MALDLAQAGYEDVFANRSGSGPIIKRKIQHIPIVVTSAKNTYDT